MTAVLRVRPDTAIVVAHFDNGCDELRGGFDTATSADAWAEQTFGRDRSCLSWDVYGPRAGDIGEDQKEWIFEPISEPGVPEPVSVPQPSEPTREPVPA